MLRPKNLFRIVVCCARLLQRRQVSFLMVVSVVPHWAFVLPRKTDSTAQETVVNSDHPIDRFIDIRLKDAAMTPSPPADRSTLIRRATLDLTGLLPTPQQGDKFLDDPNPDAYERVLDRLLASPHFGEHWARWWLDLAHYADSDGYLTDKGRPWAWRYRQWVVDAFNDDLTFDQFTVQQLAGDLLPQCTPTERMATGFLRNTLSNREGGADLEEFRVHQVVDRTVTTGLVWLGVTIGCAECHDHKYDPFSQRDFYRLYAFFNRAHEVNIDAPLSENERLEYLAARPEYDRQRKEILAPVADEIAKLQAVWEEKILWTEAHPGSDAGWDRRLEILGLIWAIREGGGQLEGLMIVKTPVADRTPDERDRLLDYFLEQGSMTDPERFRELGLHAYGEKLKKLSESVPGISRAQTIVRSEIKRSTHIHIRGDFRQPGESVLPGVPAIFAPISDSQAADRLALARWLVSSENPLTARVTVNRLWQQLFGRGLVTTSENFGVRGQVPSHPELLDWLALEFLDKGWSVKRTLRVLMTSRAYRRSSAARPDLEKVDSENILLARQMRLRLSAESVRDTALVASDLLDRTVGGPSVRPPQPDSVSQEGFSNDWKTSVGVDRYRRGLYTFLQRTSPYAQFVTFDLPDTSRSCTKRERSNTPLQALNLLNDPVFVEAAEALAWRVLHERQGSSRERLEYAYQLALSRRPTANELEWMTRFLSEQIEVYEQMPTVARKLVTKSVSESTAIEAAAWTVLSSVLLNLDEFISRE